MKAQMLKMPLTVLILVSLAQCVQAFYNPSTGRWLSRDPIGERGGENLYEFVANNPVSRVDALGLYAFDMEVKAYIEGTRIAFWPWTFNAGTKIDHVVHVDTDAESLTQDKFIGTTIKYDSNGIEVGRKTASSGGLRAYMRCKEISTRVGCCRECHIQMIGTASDPFFYGFAPAIDYDFFVSVTICRGSIYFYYSGSHDGFPSYDFTLAGDRVHHFSHFAAGTQKFDLYSWGQYYFRGDKWLMSGL
jgi:hypothetical protein